MSKIKKRIVHQIHPNKYIRTWHTTHRINTVSGVCNKVKCEFGKKPKSEEFGGVQSTLENSPKAFLLAEVIGKIEGVKEVSIEVYEVRVEIYEAFDFDRDKIAKKITLEVRRHVYSLRQKVEINEHEDNDKDFSTIGIFPEELEMFL